MIAVKDGWADYAIMKQVQQLKLKYPKMPISTLDGDTDFSKLAQKETLFLLAHGEPNLGELRDIKTDVLCSWLTSGEKALRKDFSGTIVLLSCFSGLQRVQNCPSLAELVAEALTIHGAKGAKVEGANGYSFGTPQYQKSGRSSVLPFDLSSFYTANDVERMLTAWLGRRPNHDGGVLADKLNVTVQTGMSIKDNLGTILNSSGEIEETARKLVRDFGLESRELEEKLRQIITTKIKGNSVAERVEYLLAETNSTDENVEAWNKAIDRQYKLFGDYYLWTPEEAAFTVVEVE